MGLIECRKNVSQLFAIPDLHGCYIPELFETIEMTIQEDPQSCFVFLGDYIDRGGEEELVLDAMLYIKSRYPNNVYFLLGNHEEALLNIFYCWYSVPIGSFYYRSVKEWLVNYSGFTTYLSITKQSQDFTTFLDGIRRYIPLFRSLIGKIYVVNHQDRIVYTMTHAGPRSFKYLGERVKKSEFCLGRTHNRLVNTHGVSEREILEEWRAQNECFKIHRLFQKPLGLPGYIQKDIFGHQIVNENVFQTLLMGNDNSIWPLDMGLYYSGYLNMLNVFGKNNILTSIRFNKTVNNLWQHIPTEKFVHAFIEGLYLNQETTRAIADGLFEGRGMIDLRKEEIRFDRRQEIPGQINVIQVDQIPGCLRNFLFLVFCLLYFL